jgi:hypothetical protein
MLPIYFAIQSGVEPDDRTVKLKPNEQPGREFETLSRVGDDSVLCPGLPSACGAQRLASPLAQSLDPGKRGGS